ncbi:MAG: hypothetical protein IPG83_18035 [Novosphingobium sp.]|nr:hypothetical protein [Novosphingobium sp.]
MAFYLHGAGGPAGRTFEQILQLSEQDLERRHDYIQWIFPTFTRSEVVPESPSLTTEAAVQLRASPLTRQKVIAALIRMLEFYGMDLDDDLEEPTIARSADEFVRRRSVWMTPGNHNYRRITRMLASLQILGCPQYAVALLDCLSLCYRDHGGLIGPMAMEHWKRAVGTRTT